MRDVFVLHGTYGPSATPYGCTYIRLLRPLSHPSVAGRIRLSHGPELTGSPGVVIVERSWRDGATVADAERLVQGLESRSIPFLHTLDDDLLALDASDAPAAAIASIHRVVAFFARKAAGLLVSTGALAERMARLNPNVVVVPNHVDERLFGDPAPLPSTGVPTIGYMGTRTHEGDLRTILRGLRETISAPGRGVRVELVGAASSPRVASLFEGRDFGILEPGPDGEYPRFIPWLRRSVSWQAAVAPLQDSPLNRCKSDVKFLDYALLGVPGVYADVPAYRAVVESGLTGLLAPSTPDGFRDALNALLDDDALRARISRSARESVLATRTLAVGAHLWPEAIDRLLG
jgi:glycosyltransferase involved in cell wall biosynthesis